MKLKDCKDWRAIHLEDRVILKVDKVLFPSHVWENLLNVKVEPMESIGHYKAV